MKKSLLLTGVFCACYFLSFSQVIPTDSCQISSKFYNVVLNKGAFTDEQYAYVIPRNLKENEFCFIIHHRDEHEIVVLSIDPKHNVIIYPYNQGL
jgi:hypothetical protein